MAIQIMPGIRQLQPSKTLPESQNNERKKPSIDFSAPLITLKGLEKVWLPYLTALELVARIDEDLTRDVRHYRTKSGLLLTTLDQVIRAVLDDDLQEAGPV